MSFFGRTEDAGKDANISLVSGTEGPVIETAINAQFNYIKEATDQVPFSLLYSPGPFTIRNRSSDDVYKVIDGGPMGNP